MTPVELAALRNRVARVRLAQVKVRKDNLVWPIVPRSARCVYCGHRTAARHRLACERHRPLLLVDPKYADTRLVKDAA